MALFASLRPDYGDRMPEDWRTNERWEAALAVLGGAATPVAASIRDSAIEDLGRGLDVFVALGLITILAGLALLLHSFTARTEGRLIRRVGWAVGGAGGLGLFFAFAMLFSDSSDASTRSAPR